MSAVDLSSRKRFDNGAKSGPDTQAGSNPLSETPLISLINAVLAQRAGGLSPYLSQRSRLVLALQKHYILSGDEAEREVAEFERSLR